MKNIFMEHPHSIGESYIEHLKSAFFIGSRMILGGLACMTHAFLPFVFKKTGSNVLFNVSQYVINRTTQIDDRIIILYYTIGKKMNHPVKETVS